LITPHRKRPYAVTIKDVGDWEGSSWSWEVRFNGEVISSGINEWRVFAVKAVKRTIRLHAKGKVDTAGSEFTIWH
jgi:hypothetical protein